MDITEEARKVTACCITPGTESSLSSATDKIEDRSAIQEDLPNRWHHHAKQVEANRLS
jgi:hypothetical protein